MAEIRVKIHTPKGMNDAAFRKALLDGLKQTEKGILKDFEDTTETWEHEVEFKHGAQLKQDGGRAYVETNDEIYGYVNNGTKPHPIPTTGLGWMRFRWGGKGSYRPKTRPGRFGSKPGGPSGPWVTMRKVQHPGTDPRKFDELIANRWRSLFKRTMTYAVQDAAKASGHGIP
jgi:hypothetical protein